MNFFLFKGHYYCRVAGGQGKFGEIQSQGKVSEKSGNLEISQGNVKLCEIWSWSGKFHKRWIDMSSCLVYLIK